MYPCRCDFDNEADFIKYGEAFFELEVVEPPTRSSFKDALDKLSSYPIPLSSPVMFATKEWWDEFWKDMEEWFKSENKP